MYSDDPHALDALVAAIWGHKAVAAPEPIGPELREVQNQALSLAIRAYLQSYLDDIPNTAPGFPMRL